MSSFSRANGVRHTEKISSYTRNLTKKKKLGSSNKVIIFILKKSSIINEFSDKIKTLFFLHVLKGIFSLISI